MVIVLPFAAATTMVPTIAPGAVGVAVIVTSHEALMANEPPQPVAEMPTPEGVTVTVLAAAVPLLVIFTVAGVEILPTSTEPSGTVVAFAVRFALPAPPSIPPSGVVTGGFVSLPPQPTTVSAPMSPRHPAWSTRLMFLEHVMYIASVETNVVPQCKRIAAAGTVCGQHQKTQEKRSITAL